MTPAGAAASQGAAGSGGVPQSGAPEGAGGGAPGGSSPCGDAPIAHLMPPSRAASAAGPEPAFAMSVDVEDYFQVQAFAGYVSRGDWESYPVRVEANTERILALMAEAGALGTFFILGWVATRYPGLVRRIAAAGHEIGSHGMSHRMVTELGPAEMLAEVRDSRSLLEDLSGTRVEGYRAPSYTINQNTYWALETLLEAGYTYDSSMFPIRGRRYGYPEGPTQPVRLPVGHADIAEFPMTTVGLGPVRIPVLAGSYLRLLPSWVSLAVVQYQRLRGFPLVVNIHPWEVDPGQPTIGPSRRRSWSHYSRLGATAGTLRSVLHAAPFASLRERLRALGVLPEAPAQAEAHG
jgi:polysaccharide deacetylase family protein (PEP-CTERM system associated)